MVSMTIYPTQLVILFVKHHIDNGNAKPKQDKHKSRNIRNAAHEDNMQNAKTVNSS
jgi:hypothetical protein